MNRKILIATIGVLLLVLIALMLFVLTPIGRKAQGGQQKKMVTGTNPTLDIRYQYDSNLLVPGPNDPRSEYPFQLDGVDWGLYGKRIRGLGAMLETAPGAVLFDLVASEHTEAYEDWYRFEMVEEDYEDATIQGKLAVHCTWLFEKNEESKDWPDYFPESVKPGSKVHMHGWAMFSNNDLFYFYTFSPYPIGDAKQTAVIEVLNSIEFGALLGSDQPTIRSPEPQGELDQPDTDEPKPTESTQ